MVRTCYNHSHDCRCRVRAATVAVAAPAAAEGTPAPATAADVKGAEELTFDKMAAWLMERGLLDPEEGLSEEQVVRRYNALSKCTFSNTVRGESRQDFLSCLVPCEAHLAAK